MSVDVLVHPRRVVVFVTPVMPVHTNLTMCVQTVTRVKYLYRALQVVIRVAPVDFRRLTNQHARIVLLDISRAAQKILHVPLAPLVNLNQLLVNRHVWTVILVNSKMPQHKHRAKSVLLVNLNLPMVQHHAMSVLLVNLNLPKVNRHVWTVVPVNSKMSQNKY